MAVFGLGPVGCTPQEVANYGASALGCVNSINDEVQLFNNRIKPLVDQLNANLVDAHYIYINVSNISPALGNIISCLNFLPTILYSMSCKGYSITFQNHAINR